MAENSALILNSFVANSLRIHIKYSNFYIQLDGVSVCKIRIHQSPSTQTQTTTTTI